MIRLSGLTKRYGERVAVSDLALTLAPGELFTLFGPSGCGKTTVLRLLAGLLAPDAGTVTIDGKDVGGVPPERRSAPMVFQDHLLFPHLTVEGNVGFGLRMRGEDTRRIRERTTSALASVQLEGLGGRFPAELSGGQKQRVALARALVLEPKVLLLDEPFSSLDEALRQEMRELLRRLRRERALTTLLVTHDVEEALSLSDRLGVMLDGRMRQVGTPEEVFRRPADAAVARTLGNPGLVAGRVEKGAFVPAESAVALPLAAPFASWSDGPALAVLRPEETRLVPGRSAAPGLDGTVESARFEGVVTRYELRIGRQIFGASLPSVVPTFAPGGAARLAWDETLIALVRS